MTPDLRGTGAVPRRRSAALAGIGLACAAAVSACGGPVVTAPPSSLPATPPVESPVPDPAGSVQPVTTVVVTDDPAVAAARPTVEDTWVGGLADRLEAAGSPLALTSAAVDPSGFVAHGSRDGTSFTDLVVEHVVHETQLVVFFEADLGAAGAAEVTDGALEAFNAVEEAAPDAYVVVVGPHQYRPGTAEVSQEIRQAVRNAAQRAEVVVDYIDPVAEGWPAGVPAARFAELVLPHVAELVAGLSQSGAFD
jgi:hypothetical protein